MRKRFMSLVVWLMALYVSRYGCDTEDKKCILVHLLEDAAARLGLNIEPETAADYLAYTEEEMRHV